ncbi:enoyl-CoA hydratase/isomerase family protein [Actinomycetospora straminea]|uniref:Enoyl-CoA hydratase/isomerase family protein n=1 Tax=Actinomycetospora straminea TaxID=663607 RepID=A0ABP9EML0_9PSEU|nr:enoyl-CoA hydratase/isomerase family protein [Actinomycetospora straminea]MDD7933795.1 enoyl-CoA hydratase/isomerase family protein [Actinomycetospora straminea]
MSGAAQDTELLVELLVEVQGPVTRWTLNRPHRLNALSPSLVAALGRAIDTLPPSTRVLVIGARGRAFCAGGDLEAVSALGEGPGLEQFHDDISSTLSRLAALPVPVVAAVGGLAVAGGLEVVLACDLVVAAESAVFGDGHARYGLLPGGGGSVRLPRRLGSPRAKYLLYTGESVPAATMESWGLVCRVVPDADLDAAVDDLAATLAARSPDGLRRMKTLVDEGLELPVEEALRREQEAAAEHARSADYREGVSAFRERRTPAW